MVDLAHALISFYHNRVIFNLTGFMINPFQWDATVRDYELDSQGIVNNAVYVHYLEQSRNEYIRGLGLDIHAYAQAGYHLVLAHLDIRYRLPLRAYEAFYVTVNILRYDRIKIDIEQHIVRQKDQALVVKAIATIACVDHRTGKACMPDMLKTALAKLPIP